MSSIVHKLLVLVLLSQSPVGIASDHKSSTSERAGDENACKLTSITWKNLGTQRKKSANAAWHDLGDKWQKWSWSARVENTSDTTVRVRLYVYLYSDEDIELDSSGAGLAEHYKTIDGKEPPPGTVYREYQPTAKGRRLESIAPGNSLSLQGLSEYNATAKYGEGSPDGVRYRLYCYQ